MVITNKDQRKEEIDSNETKENRLKAPVKKKSLMEDRNHKEEEEYLTLTVLEGEEVKVSEDPR